MDDHDDWLNMLVRRAAQEAVGGRQFKGTLVCTGYKPEGHLVKGMIVPHGIESGWMQLAAIHAGNGFGVVIGPKVGDPQKLDGDQFDIDFDMGDPNTPVARHRMHSSQDVPPVVQSGEVLLMQEGGTKVFFDQTKRLTVQQRQGAQLVMNDDKSITLQHASGTNVAWDADGNITHDSKDKTLTITASGGGSVALNASQIALTGSATLNGMPISTS